MKKCSSSRFDPCGEPIRLCSVPDFLSRKARSITKQAVGLQLGNGTMYVARRSRNQSRKCQGTTELWRDRIMGFYWSNMLLKTESLTQRAQRPQRKKEFRRSEQQSPSLSLSDLCGLCVRSIRCWLHLHKQSCQDCRNVTDSVAVQRAHSGNRVG